MLKLKTKELFPFQEEDVQLLYKQSGCLIANEMGTGKTIEGIAIDQMRRKGDTSRKTLVVCPKSSISNTWGKHFSEQTDLPIFMIDPKNRDEFIKAVNSPKGGIFIAHWDALRLIVPAIRQTKFFHIIADEVHRMGDRKSQQTRNMKYLKADFKTALSGTPATTRPHQYWSVLNWLWPSEFRSYWTFYKHHIEYEIVYPQGYHKFKGVINEDELLAKLKGRYVRHLKKERCCEHHPFGVMPELPDKLPPENIFVDLTPEQKRSYKAMSKEMIAWVGRQEDKPLVAPVVIAKLCRLQQLAIAYADVDWIEDENVEGGGYNKVVLTEPSCKLDAVMEIILDNPTEQIVVFSQFRQSIELLGKRLANLPKDKKIEYALFTGGTSDADRRRIVDEFLEGKIRVFAGVIKAGGVGLDLYSASTIIFIDRSWSPAENLQAEDRLHRYGQRNVVRVINILSRGTIDASRNEGIDASWKILRKMLGDA